MLLLPEMATRSQTLDSVFDFQERVMCLSNHTFSEDMRIVEKPLGGAASEQSITTTF